MEPKLIEGQTEFEGKAAQYYFGTKWKHSRVFCQVYPLLPDEGAAEGAVVCYPTSMESLDRGIELIESGQKYLFTFDWVFNAEASHQDVFFEEISQLVQCAFDGYEVCIFAYGQTGSCKTYTMMGRPGGPEEKALIPRSLEQIFETSRSLQAQGREYKMQNWTIRDLLSTNRSIGSPDLTVVGVRSIKEISSLLRQAAARSRALINKYRLYWNFVD